jgi:hypothetical protein
MRGLANWLVGVATAATTVASPLYSQSSRDSAGVLVVQNERPTWSDMERLFLAATPRLMIGNTADSVYRFRQVRGVMLLSDGRIAVADGASLQLRLFSSQGQFLSVSGGRGNGPGQMLNMHWVRRLRGDTIAIGSGLSTAALYTKTGQFVRTAAFQPRAESPSVRPYLLVTLLNSEVAVTAPLPDVAPRSSGSRWTESLSLKLMTNASDVPRDLGAFPYLEMEQVSSGPTPVWLSSIGVFVGSDDRFYAGFGDRSRFESTRATGR